MNSCCARGVTGLGPTNTGVMIIGIAPGSKEIAIGKPFQGPSGKLLDAVLDAVEWPRDKVYTTNLICSFNNEPTDIQLAACAPRLQAEIHRCASQAPMDVHGRRKLLIITMGKIPSEHLFKQKFGVIQGAILDYTKHFNVVSSTGISIAGLSTFHPSGILQSNDKPDFQNDFATSLTYDLLKVKAFMTGESHKAGLADIHSGHVKYPAFELVTNPERAQAVLDRIDDTYSVVLDIETDYDKDAENGDAYGSITCVGLRYTARGASADSRSIAVITREALVGLKWPTDLRYVGHNMYGFDAVAMRKEFDVVLPIVGDTFVKSYAYDERTKRGLHKLKNRSREFCGAGFYEDEGVHSPGMDLYTYNANDVYYTDELDNYLERQFDDTDRKLYYDLLLPAANMYSECQFFGVNIDVIKLVEVGAQFINEAEKLETELISEAARDGFYGNKDGIFNLASWQQVLNYMTKHRGLKVDSTSKEALEDIEDTWVYKLQKHRRLKKAYATYIQGTMRQIKWDGHAHPKPLIPGTRTGRPSYIDPPVNTLPHARSVGELSIVRSIFVPDSDEYTLIELDYEQIELYILQALSKDANMLADLREPWRITGKPNYHSRTCETIIGGVPCPTHAIECSDCKRSLEQCRCPRGFNYKTIPSCVICIKWEADRDAQKHVNFTIPYGGTAVSLHRPPPLGTGQPLMICQGYIDAWYGRNTDVLRWQQETQKALIKDGVVSTPFGRKFRSPLVVNSKQLRQIINAPVQSIASDYTLTSAIELHSRLRTGRYGERTRILWTTYDSMLLHVHKDYEEEVENLAIFIMTKPKLDDFPSIAVDVAKGENLYAVKA